MKVVMHYATCRTVLLSLACLPLLATASTNRTDCIELHHDTEVVRIRPGRDEPASSGSYDVRVYDATNGNELAFVDGIVLPRDGALALAWYSDLNGDGQPELAVWTVSAGSGSYGQLDILYWVDGRLEKADTPELAKSWQRGYQGHDTYRIEKGTIYRVFPIYKDRDVETQPTGGERTFKLICEKDRWMWRLHAVK